MTLRIIVCAVFITTVAACSGYGESNRADARRQIETFWAKLVCDYVQASLDVGAPRNVGSTNVAYALDRDVASLPRILKGRGYFDIQVEILQSARDLRNRAGTTEADTHFYSAQYEVQRRYEDVGGSADGIDVSKSPKCAIERARK